MAVHHPGAPSRGDTSAPEVTALVIAGGRGRRLGGGELGHKAAVQLGHESMLARTLTSIAADIDVVIVGPPLPGIEREASWVQEDPPGAGPLAAVGAGLELSRTNLIAIVAGDIPRAGEVIGALRTSLGVAADAAVLTQPDGRANPLLAVWRQDALRRALDRCRPLADQPVARLYDGITAVDVVDTDNWGADLDTPEDVVDFLAADPGSAWGR